MQPVKELFFLLGQIKSPPITAVIDNIAATQIEKLTIIEILLLTNRQKLELPAFKGLLFQRLTSLSSDKYSVFRSDQITI